MTYTDYLISTARRVAASAVAEPVTYTAASYWFARGVVLRELERVGYPEVYAMSHDVMADAGACLPGYGITYWIPDTATELHIMRETYGRAPRTSGHMRGIYSVTVTTRA